MNKNWTNTETFNSAKPANRKWQTKRTWREREIEREQKKIGKKLSRWQRVRQRCQSKGETPPDGRKAGDGEQISCHVKASDRCRRRNSGPGEKKRTGGGGEEGSGYNVVRGHTSLSRRQNAREVCQPVCLRRANTTPELIFVFWRVPRLAPRNWTSHGPVVTT